MKISSNIFGSDNSREKLEGDFLVLDEEEVKEEYVKELREIFNIEEYDDGSRDYSLEFKDTKLKVETVNTLIELDPIKFNRFIYEIQKILLKLMKCEYLNSSIQVTNFHFNGIKRFKKDEVIVEEVNKLKWNNITEVWKDYPYEFGVLIFGNVITNWKLNGGDDWKRDKFKELHKEYKDDVGVRSYIEKVLYGVYRLFEDYVRVKDFESWGMIHYVQKINKKGYVEYVIPEEGERIKKEISIQLDKDIWKQILKFVNRQIHLEKKLSKMDKDKRFLINWSAMNSKYDGIRIQGEMCIKVKFYSGVDISNMGGEYWRYPKEFSIINKHLKELEDELYWGDTQWGSHRDAPVYGWKKPYVKEGYSDESIKEMLTLYGIDWDDIVKDDEDIRKIRDEGVEVFDSEINENFKEKSKDEIIPGEFFVWGLEVDKDRIINKVREITEKDKLIFAAIECYEIDKTFSIKVDSKLFLEGEERLVEKKEENNKLLLEILKNDEYLMICHGVKWNRLYIWLNSKSYEHANEWFKSIPFQRSKKDKIKEPSANLQEWLYGEKEEVKETNINLDRRFVRFLYNQRVGDMRVGNHWLENMRIKEKRYNVRMFFWRVWLQDNPIRFKYTPTTWYHIRYHFNF